MCTARLTSEEAGMVFALWLGPVLLSPGHT